MKCERLIVFVKAPRPGAVKTRLAATIGIEAACAAYRRLAGTVLHGLATLDSVELCFTPDDAAPEILEWLRTGWTAAPQGPGDLGRRLHTAFARSFRGGAERVVIVGADSPGITDGDVRDAFARHREEARRLSRWGVAGVLVSAASLALAIAAQVIGFYSGYYATLGRL